MVPLFITGKYCNIISATGYVEVFRGIHCQILMTHRVARCLVLSWTSSVWEMKEKKPI
jgi:hypothetical protein